MNFSKISNVMLDENPMIELSSKQLSFISGGTGNKNSHHSIKKPKHSKSSSSSSRGHKPKCNCTCTSGDPFGGPGQGRR